MENWEFLLQRKGDKSWLPLESPTVEILEGQYRLAARSNAANVLVGIEIGYRPLADVRHQPLQQKIVKRISHDGLMIVMPYTNFVPGLWQIDCSNAENITEKEIAVWKSTVKFDVIQISSEAGSEWQYSDLPEEETLAPTETPNVLHTNALGIIQTEPTPLSYSSPILDIAEQRSTELVQSMFDEFSLFNDEINDANDEDDESNSEISQNSETNLTRYESDTNSGFAATPTDRSLPSNSINTSEQLLEAINTSNQPRILILLRQPQYIVNENNTFTLNGNVYTHGEIEVILRDPQTLNEIVNVRYEIAALENQSPSEQLVSSGEITFSYEVLVPPPSEIQVLIGEVRIHPQQDLEKYKDLCIMHQVIAVSYPASRVLPELIKEAQKYSAQEASQANEIEARNSSSFPQSPQSFPQASQQTENPSSKPRPANWLSLPPLPPKKPKANEIRQEVQQYTANALSSPTIPNKDSHLTNSNQSENSDQSFPQIKADKLQEMESEFANTDIWGMEENVNRPLTNAEDESELLYSFEEDLPQNYEELLEQPRIETAQTFGTSLPPIKISRSDSHNRNSRFLNKLQTLSSEAISAQKASQRTEELLLDSFPSDPLSAIKDLSDASVDLDNPNQHPLTITESKSFAELDTELDAELDRLLAPEPDLILNEYVWEESVDPNTFPIPSISNNTLSASALSETAKTIRNIQESSPPQALSEQEAIPIPNIIVAEGEIISGTPMVVIVRLPAIAPKFFVKFWIKDLQTRTIVDGPRWLLDFSTVPNTDFIETRTNISIPLSSIDVAFEAIAIEAQTQRESHKVRVVRAVTPPNLAQDSNYNL